MLFAGYGRHLRKKRQVRQKQMFHDAFAGCTRLVKGDTDNRPHPYAPKTRRGCALKVHPRLMQS